MGLLLAGPRLAAAQRPGMGFELNGVVRGAEGGVVESARVTLLELGRIVITGEEGRFRMAGVPPGRYTLEVRRPGYRTQALMWSSDTPQALDIVLEEDPLALEPLNVTVTRDALSPAESPLPTSMLGPEALARERSVSLAHALERLAGVRTLSTGREIGKPVVRGLSGSRVRVVSEGLPLEDYAWSDEDGPAVDAALVDRVEVVRGPASVLYGPGAVGGVVNVIPRPLPDASAGESVLRGRASLTAASNNRETDLLLLGEGASGDWGWRAMAIGRRSEALHTPEGELENTGFGAVNGEAALVRRGPWGNLTARYVRYGGEFRLLEEDAPAGDEGEGEEGGPERRLSDDRVQLLSNFPVGSMRLEARLQGQRHHLMELEDDPEALREGLRVEVPLFDLTLSSGLAEAVLHHTLGQDVEGTLGVSGELQESSTAGVIPLVPDATLSSAGAFVMERIERDRFTFLLGARSDVERVDRSGEGVRTFARPSWTAGISLRVTSALRLSANLGGAWRPPTLFELYASGPRLGEARYEIGRDDLEAERSLNLDLGARWEARGVHASLAAFRNDFRGFLFIRPTDEVRDGYRLFLYDQADAVLEGMEASLEVEPAPVLSLSGRADYVRGTNQARNEPLPLIPPLRVGVGAEIHRFWPERSRRAHLGVEGEHVSEPGRLNPFDLRVDGYTVLNLSGGLITRMGEREVTVDLDVRNLTNRSYRNFLSRYKAFALDPGRDLVLTVAVGL